MVRSLALCALFAGAVAHSRTAAEDIPHVQASEDPAAWRDGFLKDNGEYMPQVKNASNPLAWRNAFVQKYASEYMNWMDVSRKVGESHPNAPSSAAACHTLKQLEEWRDAEQEQMDAYIPKAYRSFSAGALDQEFQDNEARIKREQADAKAVEQANETAVMADDATDDNEGGKPAPVTLLAQPVAHTNYVHQYAGDYVPFPSQRNDTQAWRDAFVKRFAGAYRKYIDSNDAATRAYADAPAEASDCHTLGELRRWRAAQRSQIDAYMPRGYRAFAAGAIEQQHARAKERIEQEKAEAQASERRKQQASAGSPKADGNADENDDVASAGTPRADLAPVSASSFQVGTAPVGLLVGATALAAFATAFAVAASLPARVSLATAFAVAASLRARRLPNSPYSEQLLVPEALLSAV